MKFTIFLQGQIALDGHLTGYGVKQTPRGTEVYVTDEGREKGRPWLALPHFRYALSTDAPASGEPGRALFEADFVDAYLEALAG